MPRPDPDKVRAWQQRSRKRLPRESAKTKREKPTRAAVLDAVRRRDGDRCWAQSVLPHTCWGPLDGHEIAPRGRRPGGHLDVNNVRLICRFMNGWVTEHTLEAEAVGLLVKGK